MTKPKIEEIQYLRGFAFLAVVLQHAIGHYTFDASAKLADAVLMGLMLVLAKFAVPLFIYITGLVLFYNYDRDVPYLPFLRKRVRDIVLPYAPWVLVYALINGSLQPGWGSLRQLGVMIITGTSSYHLWYIVMIMQFYVVFPPVQVLVRRIDKLLPGRRLTGWLLLAALGAGYVWYTGVRGAFSDIVASWRVPFLTDLFTTYNDRNALHYFFYFLLGAAAGLHLPKWHRFLTRRLGLIRGAYAIMIGVLLYTIVDRLQVTPKLVIYYNATFLVQPLMAAFLIVSVIAMHAEALRLVAARGNSTASSHRLQGVLNGIGSLSYTAYLAHVLVLNMAVWGTDWMLPASNVTVRVTVSALICAGGSVAVAYALRRIAKLRLRLSRHKTYA